MAFIPKAPPLGDIDVFTSDAAALRPITLTDTLPKVLALAANDRLSALVARTVLGQQRGFVLGRSNSYNLCGLETAIVRFSGMQRRSAAALFLDFRTAFPSLARRWLLSVLRHMGLPPGLLRIIVALYSECRSLLLFGGVVVGEM